MGPLHNLFTGKSSGSSENGDSTSSTREGSIHSISKPSSTENIEKSSELSLPDGPLDLTQITGQVLAGGMIWKQVCI